MREILTLLLKRNTRSEKSVTFHGYALTLLAYEMRKSFLKKVFHLLRIVPFSGVYFNECGVYKTKDTVDRTFRSI